MLSRECRFKLLLVARRMGDKLIEEKSTSMLFEAKGMLVGSFSKLYEFYRKEVLCDVTICVGEKSIKCHRAILASCSPYFQAMFTTPLAESQQSTVTIRDIDESTMEVLINFAYTATIELNVNNIQSVLHASSVLQLNALTQACCDFMCSQLHVTNCLGIRQFAEQHGLFTLLSHVDRFAKLHFREIMFNEDFGDIEASHLEQLLSSDELCVNSEEQVYEALTLWMSSDVEAKKKFFPQLLAQVRLPFLSLAYRSKNVELNPLIRTSFECRDLVDEARNHSLWHASEAPFIPLPVCQRTRPRKSYSGVLYCVGGRGSSGDPFASAECYSLFHDKWLKLSDMSTSRRHVGCVAANGKIYAVGGCNEKEHMASAEVFDPAYGIWSMIAQMNTPRRGLGLCCLGGPIYAIGGLDDSVFYSVVERYDISSNLWSTVAPMNSARGGVAVAEFKGLLYAFGGNSGPVSLSTCEVYNPFLNKWTFISPMNQCRAGAGAAVLDGHIYVVGGFDNNVPLNSVERYDPEKDDWSYVAKMHTCRGGVGIAEIGKKIYAVGGHNGSNYLKTVECYDAVEDKWSYVTSIASCRAGAGVAWCPCDIDEFNTLESAIALTNEAKDGL